MTRRPVPAAVTTPPGRRRALASRVRQVSLVSLRARIPMTGLWPGPWSAAGELDRQAPARRARLVVPDGLEECGWGLVDWTGLPRRVHGSLLRAALRIARDGHTVAFTGQEYLAGPELTIDGRPCLTRHLASRSGTPATKDSLTGLLAAVLTARRAGGLRLAVVCDQPELTKDDASQAVIAGQAAPGAGGFAAVDIYGHDWTV